MRQTALVPSFVDTVPDVLDDGLLYISIRFRTASHLCACGCATTVVTPIKPAKWRLTYDGKTVSLYPSIGRWQLPCRSHYWIRKNQIIWARPFDDDEIAELLQQDAADLHDYYAAHSEAQPIAPGDNAVANQGRGLRERLNKWSHRHR